VLMREKTMLERAEIYDLVFLSMFHYHIDTPWLRAFCDTPVYSDSLGDTTVDWVADLWPLL
jgi:hypothetical protein